MLPNAGILDRVNLGQPVSESSIDAPDPELYDYLYLRKNSQRTSFFLNSRLVHEHIHFLSFS